MLFPIADSVLKDQRIPPPSLPYGHEGPFAPMNEEPRLSAAVPLGGFVEAAAREIELELSAWLHSRSKRALDITAAISLLFVLAPLLVLVYCIVRAGSPGPAVFRQRRCGQDCRLFTIYKFRTMTHAAPGIGYARKGDARLTRQGPFLRKYKLDELPQLLNVLRGEMSLVGPRPKLPEYQIGPLPCRPGLTGAASLAFAAEEHLLAEVPEAVLGSIHSVLVTPRKLKLDREYLRTACFLQDVRILVQTLLRRGRVQTLEELGVEMSQPGHSLRSPAASGWGTEAETA